MPTTQTITGWTTIKHPTFHKPFALVGTGATGDVLVVIPLFDLRDANLDGKVTLLERFSANWSGGFGLKTQEVELLMSVAVEMTDQDLYQVANKKLLAAGFSAGIQQFQKLYLKKYIGGAIGLALDQTTLNIISKYFIKRGFESVFYKFLEDAKKAYR